MEALDYYDMYCRDKLGFRNLRAYLIRRYILEGRNTGYLCKELGKSRFTVLRLIKLANLPLRGNAVGWLDEKEKSYWQKEFEWEDMDDATKGNKDRQVGL